MRIITPSRLKEFYQKHADAKTGIELWISRIKELQIENLNDLKKIANSVDVIGDGRVVFDIKGNKYRIITIVKVHRQIVYIRWVGTHAEYDKVDAFSV
ncbi:type II toxin-antitoxin system HigB family toxin [uncultured Pontibacter sp.]|uniref:type II toxin-antitoxin system HigB family toxin n=1 Tax=uncultured Pontibacter sp. TaxID=453356 RepID=UPI00262D73DA|nr:type II toxin-antitoxin system HigB family toxin [uncultured Pontibacter sp.]